MTSNPYSTANEKFRSLVRKYSDYSKDDLSRIITRYQGYEPDAVRAALYSAVDKGFISYDLSERLWIQIERNMEAASRPVKNYDWEADNAFKSYFSGSSEEDLYKMIEEPDGVSVDVYHAVLTLARDRELISGEELRNYYDDAGSCNEDGVIQRRPMFENLLKAAEEDIMDDEDIKLSEHEREKFWKCPHCGQLVEMEFAACWNCQAEIPVAVEHPDLKEVIAEQRQGIKPSPVRSGFLLILGGLLIAAGEYLRPFIKIGFHRHSSIIGYIFAGFFVLIGIGIILYSMFTDSESV